MTAPLFEDVCEKIKHAKALYHRLVLIVGGPSTGKTATLREVSERTGAPLINTNLELSSYLIDLAERQRPLQIQRFLERTIGETKSEIVLLDNTELLFDVALRQDPLRLMMGLSRNRTIVASWKGSIEGGQLCFAEPGHRENRQYPMDDILVVNAGTPR